MKLLTGLLVRKKSFLVLVPCIMGKGTVLLFHGFHPTMAVLGSMV